MGISISGSINFFAISILAKAFGCSKVLSFFLIKSLILLIYEISVFNVVIRKPKKSTTKKKDKRLGQYKHKGHTHKTKKAMKECKK